MSGSRCRIDIWAPNASRVDIEILSPSPRTERLDRAEDGYHEAVIDNMPPGTRYVVRLGGGPRRPDPASRYQPQGVHGPSEVVPAASPAARPWRGHKQEHLVIYELHVGTFSPEGTFDGIVPHLERLAQLGITAIELMPVAQFPGARNWGYDGVGLFAVQNTYGGPEGLRRLVEAAHATKLSVILDVVYNHLGPEGNHLAEFGPYYNPTYRTPWGAALNFDGPQSDEVRHFFIQNALQWLEAYDLDGLRLDAVHAILDRTAHPFLEELGEAVRAAAARRGKPFPLIAETTVNDPRIVRGPERGGPGLDATWNDDHHHALHAALTGERDGHYADYPSLQHLAKAYTHGFVYDGGFSHYRGRRHGRPSVDVPASSMVVCSQNHDVIGNRAMGERLANLIPFEAQKLSAAATILSPCLPMIFMGEEYGETNPFLYFVDHSDPTLREAVRTGRLNEFKSHKWAREPPDPSDLATFQRSRLETSRRTQEPHATLYAYHARLLAIRREHPVFSVPDKKNLAATVREEERVIAVRRWTATRQALLVLHFGATERSVELPVPAGSWTPLLDSAEARWKGPRASGAQAFLSRGSARLSLPPWSAVAYETGAT